MNLPKRGDVWLINLNPVVGHEQSGRRPCLIISVDRFNQGSSELLIVIPMTTKDKKIPIHIRLEPPEGNINQVSYIKCEDIRSVSKERFINFIGRITNESISKVESMLRLILGL